jgi:hypothetical protein
VIIIVKEVTKMTNKQLTIKEGRTELTVDPEGKDLTFMHPSYGPDTYFNVRDEIQNVGLGLPTMADKASLVHAAYNSEDKYSKEIQVLMKKNWLWAFDKNLYVPKGVYIYPEAVSSGRDLEESELVNMLESNDKDIRFVPFGFKTGSMTPIELSKNNYIRALAGEEGAEKLAKVADKFKDKPYLFALTEADKPVTRVSALNSDWYFEHRLDVNGYYDGYNGNGRAFGVRAKNFEKCKIQ